MTATKHDSQLGEIYPMMLNELNCSFGVSFSRFRCCERRGHGLWPSWFVVGRHGISLDLSHWKWIGNKQISKQQ